MTGQPPCVGMYWKPKGQDPEVAFMLVHYSADFSEHYLGGPLATRGYGVFGYGTRFRAMEEYFVLEKALDDIAAGTEWLMENTNVKKLIFIGNSGGGSLMAAFQARAEQNPSLRGGDAFIFLNAHPGRADVLTMWLDPSVIDEKDPTQRDPTLNMYNPLNGPPYSEEFQKRYREAQRQRNYRITAWAKAERQRLNQAGIPDRIFTVDRTFADLRFMDPTIDPSDRPSPACFHGDPTKANNGIGLLARANSLETWLSMWSLEDSKSRFELQAAAFSLPTLVVQCTADIGVFPSMARSIYDMVGSKQKEIRFIQGAHFFEDSQENLDACAELIIEWATKVI
jgi:pimeloyl-ACP methyl ester carboxylesterase